MRRVLFDPLLNGDPPVTLEEIAQRLLDAAPPESKDEKPGAAGAKRLGALRSGRSEASVQRMANGKLVPTRDVILDLLRILEDERGTPQRQDLKELWAAYKPALRERLPDVYEVYQVVDGYAGALFLVGSQQQEIARLETVLEQQRHRAARADEREKRARRSQAVHRQALRSARHDLHRLQGREQHTMHKLEDASAEVARLRQDVATARAKVEQWQEQAEWHLQEKEELRQESAVQQEAWLEREALLLERLAQACDTLQTAAEQAAAVEAALRAKETHWRDQAQAGHAAARSARTDADAARGQAALARAEAEAAREEAVRVLRAQRDRADALVAAVGAEQEQAQQTIGRLEEELRRAQAQLRAAQQNATQQDAQLTSFIAERALNDDLDDIVSQVLAQHQELGPDEPAWMDPRAEAIHIPSSEEPWPSPTSGYGYAEMAAIPAQPKPDSDLPDGQKEPPGGTDPGAPVTQNDARPNVSPYDVAPLSASGAGAAPAFPAGPAARLSAPQGAGPAAAKSEPSGPDTSASSSVGASSGPARAGILPDAPRVSIAAPQVGHSGDLKVIWFLFGAFAVFLSSLIIFALWVTPGPSPVAYASGSKPTVDASGSGAFGSSSNTYTWTVSGTRAIHTRFTLTHEGGTLPGHLSVQPAQGCRPNLQWTLTADKRTITHGTLTDTDTHKIKGAVPDKAKALDITATYAEGSCTATLSWVIGS
ncbi:hypothetical protein [Streptomyces sp. IBSBF 3136]|uniref:hypothetical protein n=1 Tax=Streptomyces sp. IBSBF 3136 TaxID=2903524 RepID=UPI002FDC3D3E